MCYVGIEEILQNFIINNLEWSVLGSPTVVNTGFMKSRGGVKVFTLASGVKMFTFPVCHCRISFDKRKKSSRDICVH